MKRGETRNSTAYSFPVEAEVGQEATSQERLREAGLVCWALQLPVLESLPTQASWVPVAVTNTNSVRNLEEERIYLKSIM